MSAARRFLVIKGEQTTVTRRVDTAKEAKVLFGCPPPVLTLPSSHRSQSGSEDEKKRGLQGQGNGKKRTRDEKRIIGAQTYPGSHAATR